MSPGAVGTFLCRKNSLILLLMSLPMMTKPSWRALWYTRPVLIDHGGPTIRGHRNQADWEREIAQSCRQMEDTAPLLTSVRKFTLEHPEEETKTSWQELPLSFRSHIWGLLVQPSVKEFEVSFVFRLPVVPLALCSNPEAVKQEWVLHDQAELDAPFSMPKSQVGVPRSGESRGLKTLCIGSGYENGALLPLPAPLKKVQWTLEA
ncbi:hypothetical protein BKA70DRAFT_1458917 [Coprinopsis sp. MPI-PUGE-AT-0042]|nr:hypothetical protein BKA70DRAFT_1458917 [Coprinopsis sp. MPI-PUGE-AT-0042]